MTPQHFQNRPRVLLVDDSWTYIATLATYLTQQGCEVITAADGEEAIEQATAVRPDCIVLDVVLPKKNGFQVCRQLKSQDAFRYVPIILMSSKNTPLDQRWGLQQGADMYLVKPFKPEALLSGMQRLLMR